MNNRNEIRGWGNEVKGPGAIARCRAACRAAAQNLKQFEEQFSRRLTADVRGSIPAQLIRQAWNEAEALAWSTRYPLLFLPDLAEEKIQNVRQWAVRQQEILER